METVFAPWSGAIGGVCIGLSAVLLMAGMGRVAGISGIFAGILVPNLNEEARWRWLFVIGLLLGTAWTGLFFTETRNLTFDSGPLRTAIAGLLVGTGVAWGSGCTSGHGICGIARLSTRSVVATVIFMAVAIATVFVSRHMGG
jgi:uncharacterized protein